MASSGRVRRLLKWGGLTAAAIAVVSLLAAMLGAIWVAGRLDGSLPILDGRKRVHGLDDAVSIERDDLGVPTIRATSRIDVARACGFLHAQDRFFQMDLLRRSAAGELAELVGPAALRTDRSIRVHRFRNLAGRILDRLPHEEQVLLRAYAAGVRAGLAELRYPPFEYLLLRTEPAPWAAEDSLLAVFAMYIDLQDDAGTHDSTLGLMHDLLPEELFDFLAPLGTEWDAPLVGPPFATPPVPSAEVFDLREDRAAATLLRRGDDPEARHLHSGSNNWAVAGTRTADGGALLANDMHLPLSMPNTWYRASFAWTDETGESFQVTGVTLPGTPAMVAGSNGHIAWGFTNSELDLTDLVVLETDGNRYVAGDRLLDFERFEERIRVAGADDELLEVPWTVWGPVIDRDHRGLERVSHWVAHELDAVNMGLLRMERARGLDEALEAASETRIPTQNCVVADRDGRVGWTLMGPVPRRHRGDGRVPGSSRDDPGWDGLLRPSDYPRIVDPREGVLWTANNRVVGGSGFETLTGGSFALGARARQIRDGLRAVELATPAAMLAIQLDDRAVLLERWRELLLQTLDEDALREDPRRRDLRRVVEQDWTGRASIDSSGFRMVRAFRLILAGDVFDAITARCREADERFRFVRASHQWEGPLWTLVTEQPPHLLSPDLTNWNEQLLAAADRVIDDFTPDGAAALAWTTWGDRNTVRIRHPISLVLPDSLGFVADRLDVLPEPLPGDTYMPRVQGLGHGASERFVVSPGREEQGIFHMPGGQSGHPMSPYYRKGHAAWAHGEPTPFLPGPTVHRLTLLPAD
jgi:penicillin amidase